MLTFITWTRDKMGTVESYINKPIVIDSSIKFEEVDGRMMMIPESTVIGIISDAKELDDCYQLHCEIYDDYRAFRRSFMNDELMSMEFIGGK